MIRVLHFSPHGENDGIAKYQEQYLAGMAGHKDVENEFFHVSPLRFYHLPADEKQKVLTQLHDELREYDILHIQHEFGLFVEDDFRKIVDVAKNADTKVVVSVHLSPSFAIQPVRLGGLGPRSIIHFLRQKRYESKMLQRHIEPLTRADKVLVHNTITADALKARGVAGDKIIKLVHPVYDYPEPPKSTLVADELHKKSGDIIYCTVGMMHRYKGVYDAVKALRFLPDNYKLVIAGGVHPLSEDTPMYNKVCDLINKWGLRDRVYIAGFVKDDNEFNAIIRECDVCIFPYDGHYYGHLSSGSINLAFSNSMPVIAYPTDGFKELASAADGAVVLTDTYAYYELARELKRINISEQKNLSRKYAEKMAWPKMSKKLMEVYAELV